MRQKNNDKYDEIPVFYCNRCLSLKIMQDDVLGDYCPDCGSLDVREASIFDWKRLYVEKYGCTPFKNK